MTNNMGGYGARRATHNNLGGSEIRYDANAAHQADGTVGERQLKIDHLLGVLSRLSELLSEETAFLVDMRVSEIKGMLQEKQDLVQAVEDYKSVLKQYPALLEGLPHTKQQELLTQLRIFDEVVKENHDALVRVQKVNSTVMEALNSSLKEFVASRSVYGDRGGVNTAHDSSSFIFHEDI